MRNLYRNIENTSLLPVYIIQYINYNNILHLSKKKSVLYLLLQERYL
jgi:hypothetical protein